jgi:hypothetical protein
VANRENVGFGQACNQGAALGRGRLVYLLNPDARLVEVDGLRRLAEAMATHTRWGLAGTRLVSADGRTVSLPARAYPGQRHLQRPLPALPGAIAWVGGASLCVRREVYEALGGFDPGFFLYSEETDFCLRARQAGHEIGYVDEVEVRHVGGASEEGRDAVEIWRRRLAGLHRFWLKHYEQSDVVRLLRRERLRATFQAGCYRWGRHLPWASGRAEFRYRRNVTIVEMSGELLGKLRGAERGGRV